MLFIHYTKIIFIFGIKLNLKIKILISMIKNKIFLVILFNCKILSYKHKHIFYTYIFRIYILDPDKIAVFIVGKKNNIYFMI